MTTLVLPALLTHDQASACEQVLIDASALEKFDSSALAVLLQCRRDSVASGKSFEVTGLPHQLRELANLYGISELLE
jgi:phospholipid transport system transporter-binding protein